MRILDQVATREIGKAEFEASWSSGRVHRCKRRSEARLRLWHKGRGAGLHRAPPPRPLTVGSGGFKAAAENVGCDGARLPLPQIGRQAAPAWTCLERLQPHQSLNPM